MKNIYLKIMFLYIISIFACKQQDGVRYMQPFFNESGEACIPEEKSQDEEELKKLLKKGELGFLKLLKLITPEFVILDFRKIERDEEKNRFSKFLENLESIGVYTDSYRYYLEQGASLNKNLDVVQNEVIEIETNKIVEWLKKIGLFVYSSDLRYLFIRNCGSHECTVCFKKCEYSLYSGPFKIRDYYDNKNDVFDVGTGGFLRRIISKYLENQRVSNAWFILDMEKLSSNYICLSALEYLASAKFFEMYSISDHRVDRMFSEIEKMKDELCSSDGRWLGVCGSRSHKYWKDVASSWIFKYMDARIKKNIKIDKQKTRTLSLLLGINEDFDDDLLQDAVEMIDYESH